MKYAFFHIPVLNPEPAQSELNQFLARHRIRDVSREFVNHAEHSAWCLCVIYDDASPRTLQSSSTRSARVDYREVLSPEDFDVFSPLRKRRNELADAAGIPAYSVFSNEQLATMVRRRVSTLNSTGTTTWASACAQLSGAAAPVTSHLSCLVSIEAGEARGPTK